jgi:hypothetical protein
VKKRDDILLRSVKVLRHIYGIRLHGIPEPSTRRWFELEVAPPYPTDFIRNGVPKKAIRIRDMDWTDGVDGRTLVPFCPG